MKTLYKIFGFVALAGLFASCNEDPEYYSPLGQGQTDDMHAAASVANITLTKDKETEDAVTISWKAVQSKLSPDGPVTYAVRLVNNDNTLDATKFYQVGTETSITFSVYELNSIIGRWVASGTQCNIKAEVVAKMSNNAHYVLPQISSCTFSANGYDRFPVVIYLTMLDDMTHEVIATQALTQVALGTGVYGLQVDMQPCNYYFSTTAPDSEEAGPAYVLDTERTLDKGAALKLNMGEVTVDDYLLYEDFGTTTLYVDLNDEYLDARFVNVLPLPSGATTLYIVGDACTVGWNAGVSEAAFVNPDIRNPWVYSWTGKFEYKDGNENSFKILTGSSFDQNALFAPEAWANPAVNHKLTGFRNQNDGGDVKWKIAEDVNGTYTVTLSLDQDDMWINFEEAVVEEE